MIRLLRVLPSAQELRATRHQENLTKLGQDSRLLSWQVMVGILSPLQRPRIVSIASAVWQWAHTKTSGLDTLSLVLSIQSSTEGHFSPGK